LSLKEIEEDYQKDRYTVFLDQKDVWTLTARNAIESGIARGDAFFPTFLKKVTSKKKGQKSGKMRRDFNPKVMWIVAIYKVINVIRTVKSTVVEQDSIVSHEKSLVSQLKGFQAQNDSMTAAKVGLSLSTFIL
jgi:hypothetical protein